MAFKSFNELMNMSRTDPKMAEMHVTRAEKEGKPVVSPTNPGYRGKKKNSYYDRAIKNRMKSVSVKKGSTEQEEIASKNKKVGY